MCEKIVGLHNAAEIAGVTFTTVKYWCERYGVGEKVGHQWHIDRAKLDAFMQARSHLKMLKN